MNDDDFIVDTESYLNRRENEKEAKKFKTNAFSNFGKKLKSSFTKKKGKKKGKTIYGLKTFGTNFQKYL